MTPIESGEDQVFCFCYYAFGCYSLFLLKVSLNTDKPANLLLGSEILDYALQYSICSETYTQSAYEMNGKYRPAKNHVHLIHW